MATEVGPTQVAIVGGGVIGLSSGIVLQSLGVDTVLVAENGAWPSAGAEANPGFASIHAAASVLPHSVRSPRANTWTACTVAMLAELREAALPGVRTQWHYELFERPEVELPTYAPALEGLVEVEFPGSDGPSSEHLPRRSAAPVVSGWRFRASFCEGPLYLDALHDLYTSAGGHVSMGTTSIEALVAEGFGTVVVCAGYRSPALARAAASLDDPSSDGTFKPLLDPRPMRFILGHYIRALVPGLLRGDDGDVVSYNYHPGADIYLGPGGGSDVYCYPRSDAWLLGGSRLPFKSVTDALGAAAASPRSTDMSLPDGRGGTIAIPAPIMEVNHDILRSFTHGRVDLAAYDPARGEIWAGVGLRAERDDSNDSTRVERSRVRGLRSAVIVHSYGHGGAGFALSWGCAIEVARLVLDPASVAVSGLLARVAPRSRGPTVDRIARFARAALKPHVLASTSGRPSPDSQH